MYNTCSEWGMFLEEVKLHVNMYYIVVVSGACSTVVGHSVDV